MKRVHATASFGFYGADHETDFDFEDNATEDEIYDEIYQWAVDFLDISYAIEEEEEEED